MKKKQKDYPDDCPVFYASSACCDAQVVGVGDVDTLNGGGRDILLMGTSNDDTEWLWHTFGDGRTLTPLTPAAEDLLAAIKAELGL